jgi:UDP-N-acetylmuramate dehydrogenase
MNSFSEMDIRQNVDLAQYSTFHIGGIARHLISVSTPDSVIAAIKHAKKEGEPFYIIGGG